MKRHEWLIAAFLCIVAMLLAPDDKAPLLVGVLVCGVGMQTARGGDAP